MPYIDEDELYTIKAIIDTMTSGHWRPGGWVAAVTENAGYGTEECYEAYRSLSEALGEDVTELDEFEGAS